MEYIILIVVLIGIAIFINRSRDFDDPKSMSIQHLLAAM